MSKHMRKISLSLLTSSLTLIILGVLLTDPFNLTMNNMALIVVTGLLLASFGVFAGLLWQEQPADEREAIIVDKAGRLGYLAGLSVLVLALVIQSFNHSVDSWLVITIATMIIAKQSYIQFKK
ncbi:hypothetical protein KBB49_01945 [Candidatus Saccharibacteria bacterium]|nr:hypothetical protein [Candidatus Saccharibacteria bacterium]